MNTIKPIMSTRAKSDSKANAAFTVSTTPVRIPAALRDWLKHQAIDSRRTLSNEIVVRLEESRARQGTAQQPSK